MRTVQGLQFACQPRLTRDPRRPYTQEQLLVDVVVKAFGLTLAEIWKGSNKAVAQPKIRRILNRTVQPSAFESRAIAAGVLKSLQERIQSGQLFDLAQPDFLRAGPKIPD